MGIFKFLDAVRIWWNNQYSILSFLSCARAAQQYYCIILGMPLYILNTDQVCTSMYRVCTSMYRYVLKYNKPVGWRDVWHPRVCITLSSTKSCQTGLSAIHPGVNRYTPSTYLYILVCIKYILVHAQHMLILMSMYWYIPVCTEYILVCTQYILICTFLYQVHTRTSSVHIRTTCSCLFIQGTTWYIPCYRMVLL